MIPSDSVFEPQINTIIELGGLVAVFKMEFLILICPMIFVIETDQRLRIRPAGYRGAAITGVTAVDVDRISNLAYIVFKIMFLGLMNFLISIDERGGSNESCSVSGTRPDEDR